MIGVTKRHTFWQSSLYDTLTILCAAVIPVSVGIYTAITDQQEQEQNDQIQQFDFNQKTETRRDTVYDEFLLNIHTMDKDGQLNDTTNLWAFANAYYRAAHRQLDSGRRANLVQFLKEKI